MRRWVFTGVANRQSVNRRIVDKVLGGRYDFCGGVKSGSLLEEGVVRIEDTGQRQIGM